MSTFIHPTAIVGPNVTMGENAYIGPYCIIGMPAEHRNWWGKGKPGPVIIGSNARLTKQVTVDAGTNGITEIGDNCWLLKNSHVGHDAKVENDCTLSCNSVVGGHSKIFQHSNLGLGSVVHQWCAVPSYTMLGMNSTWTKKTPLITGSVYVGSPARRVKENKHLIDKLGIKIENLMSEKRRVLSWVLERGK